MGEIPSRLGFAGIDGLPLQGMAQQFSLIYRVGEATFQVTIAPTLKIPGWQSPRPNREHVAGRDT